MGSEQMRNMHLAHISEDGTRVQTVSEHLIGTAHLSKQFAEVFGAGDQGELAGLLHDIGKYSDAFQRRLLQDGPRVDHSTAGAFEASKIGQGPIAFAVAGHHGGLPDGGHPRDDAGTPTLCGRLKKKLESYEGWRKEIELVRSEPPRWSYIGVDGKMDNIATAFYTRMLYSCLVDADFLDTETFMNGYSAPRGCGSSIDSLLEIVRLKAGQYLSSGSATPVARERNNVLRACIDCGARGDQGLYTLTVPTGGGKTFASLAFALEHAKKCGMDRVIYVIPYTSIIDQTASVFADLLGDDNVLAHYSGAEYQMKEQEDLTPHDYRQLLASENWDAPVVVTTAVQFFESLYANRSSRCRKLHNIANSVVIFDEAQTIPNDYLYPCVSAIGQLVQHYHTTAVLCTATQPVLGPIFDELSPGLKAHEIAPDPRKLYAILRRVTLCDAGELSEELLSSRLTELSQVLCIVNRRKTAQELYADLPVEGSYCLTTLLCARSRRGQLEEIRTRLKAGLPCRVISTSLIEAGVDVDFPVVYREECGLDSLLQAAGRCNREGKRIADDSRVYRFNISENPSPQMIGQNISALHYAMRHVDDLNTPEAIESYFGELLGVIKTKRSMDKRDVLSAFKNGVEGCMFPFAQVADNFRIIDTPTRDIYIPIGEGAALCDRLRLGDVSRAILRRLGEYSVSCYSTQFDALNSAGAIDVLPTGDAILMDRTQYNDHTGLTLDVETGIGIMI